MGSCGNLSKLVIPKQHWQEVKDKTGYTNVWSKDSSPDSRAASRSKLHWWVVFSLCAGLVLVSLLMFICAIDNLEVPAKRQPWKSLDGPTLEFMGVRSRWSLLGGGKITPSGEASRGMKPTGALQGMGTLLRTGTRAMEELIVAHLTEDTTSEELRLYLRSLHRSGATAKADVVLLFPSSPMPTAMANVIHDEEESFQKLLEEFRPDAPAMATVAPTPSDADFKSSVPPFNPMAFKKSGEDEQDPMQEIIWGRRHGVPAAADVEDPNPSWAAWGSIVSFDAQELDPQDALQGFFDTPPVQLRRWLCYDMLLGMIKSRFKNVLVSQVKGVYVLGDALSATRKKSALYITEQDLVWRDAKREPVAEKVSEESQQLQPSNESEDEHLRSTVVDLPAARHESIRRILRETSKPKPLEDDRPVSSVENSHDGEAGGPKVMKKPAVKRGAQTWRHAHGLIQSVYGPQVWKALGESDKQHAVVSPAVIIGGVQYVRGLANKMTSEIVRLAMEHKTRQPFHDKAVLNMWIHKKTALGKRLADHLKVVRNQESVVHSAHDSHQPISSWRTQDGRSRYLVVHQERDGATGDHTITQLRQELCRLNPILYQRCL